MQTYFCHQFFFFCVGGGFNVLTMFVRDQLNKCDFVFVQVKHIILSLYDFFFSLQSFYEGKKERRKEGKKGPFFFSPNPHVRKSRILHTLTTWITESSPAIVTCYHSSSSFGTFFLVFIFKLSRIFFERAKRREESG